MEELETLEALTAVAWFYLSMLLGLCFVLAVAADALFSGKEKEEKS